MEMREFLGCKQGFQGSMQDSGLVEELLLGGE